MMSLERKHNRHHYHQPTTLCLWVQAQSDLRCRQTDQRGCFEILQLVGADRLSMNWSHARFQALVADVNFNSGVLRRCLIDYEESPQVMNVATVLCSMAWGGHSFGTCQVYIYHIYIYLGKLPFDLSSMVV